MTINRWLYLLGVLLFGGLLLGVVMFGFSLRIIPLIVGLFAIYLAGVFISRIILRKPKSASML